MPKWAGPGLLQGRGATFDGITQPGPCAINCTNKGEVYSFHPGGANVLLADGSVHFLKASIDIRIFARLVTRAGGEVVSLSDYREASASFNRPQIHGGLSGLVALKATTVRVVR